jgi:hypothetical protein
VLYFDGLGNIVIDTGLIELDTDKVVEDANEVTNAGARHGR